MNPTRELRTEMGLYPGRKITLRKPIGTAYTLSSVTRVAVQFSRNEVLPSTSTLLWVDQ